MNMKTFAELTGLTPYTLRYYEKIGLLKGVQRNDSGHRVFSTKEVKWVEFIIRLKETGMPLEQILHYSELREQGEETILARQRMLEVHRKALKNKLKSQMKHLSALDSKIEFYKKQT